MIDRLGRILTGVCGAGLLYIGARALDAGTDLVLRGMVLVLWLIGVVLLTFAVRGDRGKGNMAW